MTSRTTGAHSLLASLRRAGVDTIFGHPGGAMLPAYDALVGDPLRHVLARHEQAAGHMAEGYARASGRFGVVFATSGPGATNLVTPLADAYLDSISIVAITAQVATPGLGREAFQEADILSITAPVTKQNEAVLDPARIADAVAEAVRIATTGRPGPVLLDIPKDVLAAEVPAGTATLATGTSGSAPAPATTGPVDAAALDRVVDLLRDARRPVLYVGGGVASADAAVPLRAVVDLLGTPVVTTLMARGQFPDDHPCHLGMPGMHGHWTATTAMQHADLLVALGTRFDDRVTGRLDGFAPSARVVHVDIDPVEIGKNRAVDVGIVGDCHDVLTALVDRLATADGAADQRRLEGWWEQLDAWRRAHPLRWDQDDDGLLAPQTVLRRIDACRPPDSIVVTGVGQHQMWAAQHLTFTQPGTFLSSGGLGTMGYGLPAAIGAKAARPDTTVIAIDGDGSFQMTLQELATAEEAGLPIVCFVLNNAGLGMVRQWQTLFHGGRRSASDLDPRQPDLIDLARAYGWVGLRCETLAELGPTVDEAFADRSRPVLVDVRVDPDEMVFPMVPSGASNDAVVDSAREWREGRGSR